MINEFWQHCLTQFRKDLGSEEFNAFIEPVFLRQDGDQLLLVSPNCVTERWLKKNIDHSLQSLMKAYFEESQPFLSYSIETRKYTQSPAKSIKKQPKEDKNNQVVQISPPISSLRNSQTFENFIQGKANSIPLSAAKSLTNGDKYISPLFIFGNTGLGKTHLVHAIGNDYKKKNPKHRILYTTTKRFVNEVVSAYRFNQYKTEALKDLFYYLDLLILDDIQHLGGNKARSQEELFSLFNALHEMEKPIVITGDCSPIHLKDIPDHLSSRFGCGVVAEIKPPEFNLRADILRQKACELSADLNEETVYFIAENVKSNVRTLEGSLKRILSAARFRGEKPSVALCQDILSDVVGYSNIIVKPELIKDKVARFFGIKTSDLSSKSRRQSIVRPRHIAIYLCRSLTTMSLPEIGIFFGNRNHTTVLHSCRYVKEEMSKDKKFSENIRELTAIIKE